ncbi:MAG TPA: glycoside hydrolase family 3 N-terminal domain-containing protein, partial [Thermoanaerobaculia bacterium]|nr:glycoside hydrolase family 3 N-terminal domain-containing protein [Thermoanaerobaculia bacterium]
MRGWSRALLPALLLALLAACGSAAAPPGAAPAPPAAAAAATAAPDLDAPLSAEASRWVDRTLAGMTVAEKAAQMVFVEVDGRFHHPDAPQRLEELAAVRQLGVGGVVLFRSEVDTVPPVLDALQAAAGVPLLVAADLERSLAFRIGFGTTPLPWAMAIGATRSAAAAEASGEITAREARALGIHWALGPVADVNNDPANPVIHLRSYGEDPELVAAMAAAFVRGARSGGVLTSAKHFPGHGDTAVDSHLGLPVIDAGAARLASLEWVPFRAAIAAGVDSVMLGHVAVPAVDPSGAPASLSPRLAGEPLRGALGFDGLIVTDALRMEALRGVWPGAVARRAVVAGADVLLLPTDAALTVRVLVDEVAAGRLAESRLDASVRRLLTAKARLGLHRRRAVGEPTRDDIGRPADVARALEIAGQAVTAVRDAGGLLPLRAEEPLHLLHVTLVGHHGDPRDVAEEELAARRVPFTERTVGPEIAAATLDELVAAAAEHSHVLVAAFVGVGAAGDEEGDLTAGQEELLRRLAGSGVPLVLFSFGSPYLLAEVPEVGTYLCAYGGVEPSRRAAFAALFGERPVGGRLPVTLPGLHPYGAGLDVPAHAMTLRPAPPAEAGFRPQGLAAVARLLDDYVARGAFPGGVLAVGHRGRLAWLHPFGRLTYDEGAPPVAADTLYDLASLTKVVATTTMAMILVDEGRLDLDTPVEDVLPGFQGPSKERVTVRHLLTHSSGLDWWAPLYEEVAGQQAYVERIQGMELVYEPGTESKYSDLALILLGAVLERAAGEPLESFVRRRVFAPLGMEETLFRPPPQLRARIAPTEVDPWRGRLVHGEVHDENAFALGGVAPHAGLFATAGDLARFAQMVLWGGVYDHHRLASRETVERFARLAGVPGSSRALGWDTKSPQGSSAGELFAPRSFGHTGFTGTSLWIDPERELFVVLLTNRVHPTRDNALIREARPAVHDAVVRALAGQPAVEVGLERLALGARPGLLGKRLGLLAHAASVTADGRHAFDVLRGEGLDVVRLFSPEHGWRGAAAAGETVPSGREEGSGLPLVSLYGERRKPTPEELAGLDALVVDLQGGGVRFYTYVSTLLLALEAAAEA